MKKFLFLSFAISLVCAGCGDEPKGQEDNPPEIDDTVVTLDASSIKTTSAVLNGIVNSDAVAGDRLGVTKCGFIISTDSYPTEDNGLVLYSTNLSNGTTYSVCAKNLASEESYYYTSFFYDGTKYYYGETLSFTTVKFESSKLKAEAIAKGTSVNLKGIINYEEVGFVNDFKVGFDIGDAVTFEKVILSEGENYIFEATMDNISAAKEYEYYFFLEYFDINGIQRILRSEKGTFYADFDLPTGAVDLGLSVLWSSVNVGASSPEEFGDFFAWGEVVPKSEYTPSSYLYTNKIIGNDIMDSTASGQHKSYSIIGTEYDAATVNMGSGWKMPTEKQCDELADECEWTYMKYKGGEGFLITGKNGNRIFLPECGEYVGNEHRIYDANYWTGECQTNKYAESGKFGNTLHATVLTFLPEIEIERGTVGVADAYYGLCIRPIKEK